MGMGRIIIAGMRFIMFIFLIAVWKELFRTVINVFWKRVGATKEACGLLSRELRSKAPLEDDNILLINNL